MNLSVFLKQVWNRKASDVRAQAAILVETDIRKQANPGSPAPAEFYGSHSKLKAALE